MTIKIDLIILNNLGLHARASAKMTQTAGQFPCEVWLSARGKRVNGKSIMGVMMLAAGKGTPITVETTGEQSLEASQAIAELVNNFFGEGA
jgi:phosphocarrier protein HPr